VADLGIPQDVRLIVEQEWGFEGIVIRDERRPRHDERRHETSRDGTARGRRASPALISGGRPRALGADSVLAQDLRLCHSRSRAAPRAQSEVASILDPINGPGAGPRLGLDDTRRVVDTSGMSLRPWPRQIAIFAFLGATV